MQTKTTDEEPEEFMHQLRQVIIQHSGLGIATIQDELLTNLFVEGLLPSLSKQIKLVEIGWEGDPPAQMLTAAHTHTPRHGMATFGEA